MICLKWFLRQRGCHYHYYTFFFKCLSSPLVFNVVPNAICRILPLPLPPMEDLELYVLSSCQFHVKHLLIYIEAYLHPVSGLLIYLETDLKRVSGCYSACLINLTCRVAAVCLIQNKRSIMINLWSSILTDKSAVEGTPTIDWYFTVSYSHRGKSW